MEVDLTGQVALVRGAEGPWGEAIADRLALSGASVARAGSPQDVRREAGRLDVLVSAEPMLLSKDMGSNAAFDAARNVMADCEGAAAMMARGRIVNVGSVFGLVPCVGAGHVAAANAAMFIQTRAMALEAAARGILINGVAVMVQNRSHTPLARAARPDDVAAAVLFLLAAASSYVVGEIIRVDGGWSAGFAREF